MHAADPVGEIVILRGGDRGRQMIDAEFRQPRQETLLLLAAEHAEDELGGIGVPRRVTTVSTSPVKYA